MRRSFGVALLVALVCSAANARDASATVHQTFSGQFCQGNDAGDRANVLYGGYGTFNDSNSSFIDLTCPISWQGDHEGVDPDWVYVYYYDRNSSTNVSCTVKMLENVYAMYSTSTQTSSGSSSDTQSFSFDVSGYQDGDDDLIDFSIDCDIPAVSGDYSGIGYYRVAATGW